MLNYIIRRILYAVPILIGVNLITAVLFFYLNSPDDMAYKMLGEKNITAEAVTAWKAERGYDKPLFINTDAESMAAVVTDTIFFEKSLPLLWLDFGTSDRNNIDIGAEIRQRMWPSFIIALPTFMLGIITHLTFAMLLAYTRGTYIDRWGVIMCVVLMSVSSLFYIIGGQFIMGKVLRLLPISGYDVGIHAIKFAIMPVLIGVMTGLGSGARFYRTVFLEEINKDYVRTARAKGLSENAVLFKHALKNAMIPVLTNIVVAIPFLFYGALVMESFFAIPGLGSFILEAIQSQDFSIVRSMVYLGSVLYIAGLVLTDISYTMVDPRVRLQ